MKKLFLSQTVFITFVIFLCTGYSHAATDKSEPVVSAQSLFSYDRGLPLMQEEKVVDENDSFVKYHVRYFSVNGQFVTGLLTLPKKVKAPFPAVIFQHGFGGHKESEPLIKYGTGELVKNGYAVISIDAAMHGERKTALTRDASETTLVKYPYVMRDVFVQTIIDVRRAVDYLQKRGDIDKDRIYYMGISMGAIQGVIMTAMEKRIKGLITVVGGGNLMECNPLYKAMPGPKDLLAVMEPVNFAAKISPRPVLMLNGKNDPIIPPACAKALFAAMGEPKEQIFYDTKHAVPLEEGMDKAIKWLKEIQAADKGK